MHEIIDAFAPGDALDAACGTGRYAEYLAGRGHRVFGVDSSPDMLEQARRRVPSGEFLLGDLRQLPVPDNSVDLVVTGLALNQLRLFTGDARLRDDELRAVHEEFPLLYLDSHALRAWELTISDGLFMSVDLSGPPDRIVGYRAKKNSLPIDLGRVHGYGWRDFWEPVYPEARSRIVLEPEIFYLLLSAEGACIPPGYAAEMTVTD